MRRWLVMLAAALMLTHAAGAEDWSPGRRVECIQDVTACHILQMVMMGEFHRLDASDGLSVRVHASIYPRLTAITEEDIAHFLAEFDVAEDVLRRSLDAALGYCLWADILMAPEMPDERQNASRKVLLLFLRPETGASEMENRAIIRSMLTDEIIKEMAVLNRLETAFLEHIFYSDDWRDVTMESTATP